MEIFAVTADKLDAVHDLHRNNVGDFLVPLSRAAFAELVTAGQVFAAASGGRPVGLVYVKPDDKTEGCWEYGGLYVAPEARGGGVATRLSEAAITAVAGPDPRPVMAYVHRENRDPAGLMTRLGFRPTGRTLRVGPERLTGFLRRDADGSATANVLVLAVDTAVVARASYPEVSAAQ